MKKLNIYIDLDDVLAKFSEQINALIRFATEVGFFRGLEPNSANIQAVKELAKYCNIYIITASPNEAADNDKREWCHEHLSWVPDDHIIIIRLGESKADHMVTDTGILLDDYGKNCREWFERGNIAYKIRPGYDINFWAKLIITRQNTKKEKK